MLKFSASTFVPILKWITKRFYIVCTAKYLRRIKRKIKDKGHVEREGGEEKTKEIYLGFNDAMSKYSWLSMMATPRLGWSIDK